jgi:hypothetical protein
MTVTDNDTDVLTGAGWSGDSGTSTGIGATTLTDTGKQWGVGSWVSATVTVVEGGHSHTLVVDTTNDPTVVTDSGGWTPHQPTGTTLAYTITGGAPGNSLGYQLEDPSTTMTTALSLDTWYWVALQTRDANLAYSQSALRLYNSSGTLVEEISKGGSSAGMPASLAACWLGMFYITTETAEVYVGGNYATTGGRWPPPAPWFLARSTPNGIPVESGGTSTAIGATTLTHTGKTWPTVWWVGATVLVNDGVEDHTLTVTSNTATVLTGSAGWAPNEPTGETLAYTITGPQGWTPSAGTAESCVDDVNPTNEADYISTSATGKNHEFTMSALAFDKAAASATSVNATSLTHTGAFTANRWRGGTVTCNTKTGVVASNTADVLTLTAAGWTGGTPTGSPLTYTIADNVLGLGACAYHYEAAGTGTTRCRLSYNYQAQGSTRANLAAATTYSWIGRTMLAGTPNASPLVQWTPTTANAANVRVVSITALEHRVSSIVKWGVVGVDWADDIPRSSAADLLI